MIFLLCIFLLNTINEYEVLQSLADSLSENIHFHFLQAADHPESALDWGVLKMEVSLYEDSCLFWGTSLFRVPYCTCLCPLPLLTSCSNLRIQGTENPGLTLSFSFLLRGANCVPHKAQRPETATEEKTVSNTRLTSLSLSLWDLTSVIYLFFYQSHETTKSYAQLLKLLTFCSWCKWHAGAGEVAQWLQHMLYKCEDWSLDLQNPHKCQVGMAPHL